MKNSPTLDPIVIDPPGFNPKDGWAECSEYVEKCGGLTDDDGEVNWRAAFGADPGICSCPNCHQAFWAWGRKVECTECHFQFPTNWWPEYSYGCQDAARLSWRIMLRDFLCLFHHQRWFFCRRRLRIGIRERLSERLMHPYYRDGFEHPVADPWAEHEKINWREILKGQP